MKALSFLTLLIAFQIVIVNCKLESRSAFSCAIGINYASLSDMVSEEFINPTLSRSVEAKVSFHLYTKEKPLGEEISISLEGFRLSSFNVSRPTNIITHGYYNKGESDACAIPRDAILQSKDSNVIVVDWWKMESVLGVPVTYSLACKQVPIVAEYLAKMIDFLEYQGLNLNKTTLIGHSLGAHLMGIAASKARGRINHIIGLDPAGPRFEEKDPSERLSPDDANTVHVIHTNEGDCGMSRPVGHFDFYPNGGNKQPGCTLNPCAHSRAFELYAESIYSENGFYANLCPNVESAIAEHCVGNMVKMDETLRNQNAEEGIYYLKTSDASPYALGK